MPDDYHNNDSMTVAWTILDIKLYNATFNGTDIFASGTIVHELAHVWDTRQWPPFKLSKDMNSRTKSFTILCNNDFDASCFTFNFSGELPPTPYGQSGPREDFAESFTVYVYPSFKGSLGLGPIRKNHIEGLIKGIQVP